MADLLNQQIAGRLEEAAHLLREQGADPFRVNAYLRAAASVRRWPEPVSHVFRDRGLDGLEELPAVGPGIARAIRELVTCGRLPMLDRLRGAADPLTVLMSVPGIGRRFAERLHDELGLDTLEALEAAAHDGRLETIAGFGEKRLAGIRDSLAHRLGRVRGPAAPAGGGPPVEELLDVDREYRRKAAAGELRSIAPRRFNPAGDAWLPVLHTRRGARRYTALFSNTARAHRAGKTGDWVVLYIDDGPGEHQYTVITAGVGPLRGQRVVAGHEREGGASSTSSPRDGAARNSAGGAGKSRSPAPPAHRQQERGADRTFAPDTALAPSLRLRQNPGGTMSTKAFTTSACAVALLGVILAAPALAQPIDKRTFFTFSGPIAVPGVTLPAGKYLFRIANPDSSSSVVQILSADGKTPYSMFHTLRARRLDAAPDPEIRFLETAAGMPAAVRTWWHPGDRDGFEFVYPKNQARLLAKGTGQPVLTEAAPDALARVAPSGEEITITTEAMPELLAGKGLAGELAPLSIAVPESLQARTELPRTASTLPLVGVVGAILLLGAGLITGWRTVRT